MSLIFDEFPDKAAAEAFQRVVRHLYPKQPTHIWLDQDEMEHLYLRQLDDNFPEVYGEPLADLIPAQLQPPIVLVERFEDSDTELHVAALAEFCGGNFSGT